MRWQWLVGISLFNDFIGVLYLGIGWIAIILIAFGKMVYCTTSDEACPDVLTRYGANVLPSNMDTYVSLFPHPSRMFGAILPVLFRLGTLVLEVYIAVLPSLRFDKVVADVDVAAVTAYGELRDWVIMSEDEQDHRGRVARLTQIQSYVDAMKHKDIAARHAFQVCGIPINCLCFSRLLRAMLAFCFIVLVPAFVIIARGSSLATPDGRRTTQLSTGGRETQGSEFLFGKSGKY